MSLFNKKEKNKEEINSEMPELPKLPELTKLFPEEEKDSNNLPSFPKNSLGEEFSRNTIKNAISGEKENKKNFEDNFEGENEKMTQTKVKKTDEIEKENVYEKTKSNNLKKRETVFVRIDKFEEGLKLFEKIKKKVTEIEKMFDEVKKIKEEEKQEIDDWKNEISSIKEKIEKLDSDIFTRLE